jgi:hypothetical protein
MTLPVNASRAGQAIAQSSVLPVRHSQCRAREETMKPLSCASGNLTPPFALCRVFLITLRGLPSAYVLRW